MKSIFLTILIFIGIYWASSISGKKQAEDLVRAEIARNNTSSQAANLSPVALAKNLVSESKSRGIPRKSTDEISLIDIEFKNNIITSKYVFDRPASMPIPANMIIEAKNEILANFKNSGMCKTGEGNVILQSGINVQQHYFLIGGTKPSFSIIMGFNNC